MQSNAGFAQCTLGFMFKKIKDGSLPGEVAHAFIPSYKGGHM
jgi:hypothetical protein